MQRTLAPSRTSAIAPLPTPAPPARGVRPLNMLLVVAFAAALVWSGAGTRFSLIAPFAPENLKAVTRFVQGAFPPDLSPGFLLTALRLVVETIQISIVGTVLAIGLAFPLSVLAMRRRGEEFSPRVAGRLGWTLRWAAYAAARTVLNVLRAVPELVWALIFVVAVGLGPYAGVLALAAHSTGILGKLYAELCESVDARAIEAGRATGASELAVLLLVRVPMALPVLLSYTLFRWECNMRAATVLGFVGAGGLGTQLVISMKLFQYGEVTTLALVLLGLVMLVDAVGQLLRTRLLEHAGDNADNADGVMEEASLCRPADG
ncbi:MAG: phosphonate ABC transporter, permease protein PhnE [Chloroflexota bacterium]